MTENQPRISKRGRVNEGRPTKWTEEASLALGQELIDWLLADKSRVFIKEFLVEEKGLYSEVIHELSSKWPEFSKLIKRAKEIQEVRLLKQGGQDTIKSIFALKNHHGYVDKQEVKTENVNYNYDPADLRAKTADELLDLLNQETNTTR